MTAGLGTRLRPFTNTCAKPLLPVLGQSVISMAIQHYNDYSKIKNPNFLFNLHYRANDTEKKIRKIFNQSGCLPQFQNEEKLILDAAGGLREAGKYFKNEFIWSNGDNIFPFNVEGLVNQYRTMRTKHGISLCLYLRASRGKESQYRELKFDSDNLLSYIGENKSDTNFFAGAAVVHPDALRYIDAKGAAPFLKDILEPLLKVKEVGVFVGDDFWIDIGDPFLWIKSHRELFDFFSNEKFDYVFKKNKEHFLQTHRMIETDSVFIVHQNLKIEEKQIVAFSKLLQPGSFFYLGIANEYRADEKVCTPILENIAFTDLANKSKFTIIYLDAKWSEKYSFGISKQYSNINYFGYFEGESIIK